MPSLPGSCHGLAPRQEGTGAYRPCIRLIQKQHSESSGFKYGVKCAEEGALSAHTGGGKSWELRGGRAGRVFPTPDLCFNPAHSAK